MAKTTRWQKFPEPVQDTFEDIWNDVASLHFKWTLYLDLYGTPESLVVLNGTAPAAFQVMEESLRSDITMSLCRLLDPANQGKDRDNISLERLAQELRPHLPSAFADRLDTDVKELETHCEPFLRLRNKRLAHNDLKTALNLQHSLYPKRPILETALMKLRDLMNAIQGTFEDAGTHFEYVIAQGKGDDLVFFLRRYGQLEAAERQRMIDRVRGVQ